MRISIIGAGPAGAMAAAQLARAGARVSLFDPSHPREKPCGGGLTGRALALVSDLIDINMLDPVVVRSAAVEPPSLDIGALGSPSLDFGRLSPAEHRTAEVTLTDRGATPDSSLIVVSRAVFDRALAEAAVASGARLIQERAVDVFRRGRTMIVRTTRREYDSEAVLGADGANSLVRRKLAAPFGRAQLSIAAGFFAHGVSASTISIKSMGRQPGYLWSFPRRDHLAVGICAPATHGVTSEELRAQSRSWIEAQDLPPLDLRPYAWPIPSVGREDAMRLTAAGPGWMLLGDAAGLVDPLTREGIYYALLSGRWAAESLAADSGGRAAARYATRLREEVQPELARAARLSALFFSPRFSSLFVTALNESAPVRDVFVDLVSGVQTYRGLRRRLLATREWRLAGQAIRLSVMPGFAGTIKSGASPHAT